LDDKLFLSRIAEYREGLTADPNYRYKINSPARGIVKGELNKAKWIDETEKLAKLQSAVNLFEKYNKKLRESSFYDFSDMINWVNQLFDKKNFLLRRYQEQYLHVLVDEFQDTNGSQLALIRKLVSFWDNPSLMVVGDDNQAIYGFQGARLQNSIDLIKSLEDITIVRLSKNYRSHSEIVLTADRLNQYNTKSIQNSGILPSSGVATEAVNGVGGKLSIKLLLNEISQSVFVANEIEKLIEDGVNPSQIAVIYSKHKQSDVLIRLLKGMSIPLNVKRKEDVLKSETWRDVSLFLNYLVSGSDYYMSQIIHLKCFNLNPTLLAQAMKNRAIGIAKSLEDGEYKAVSVVESIKALDKPEFAFFLAFFEKLELLKVYSVIEIYDFIINNSGISYTAIRAKNSRTKITELRSIFDMIKIVTAKNQMMSVSDFLSIISSMEENRISYGVETEETSHPESVNFITAHGAKGLEFDHVFLYDATDSWHAGRNQGFYIPSQVTFSSDNDEEETSRRAFYVAMTRARKSLTITLKSQGDSGKIIPRCKFLDELEVYETPPTVELVDEELMKQGEIAFLLQKNTENKFGILLKPHEIDEALAHFRLSPTSLNIYNECGLTFYFDYVLGYPRLNHSNAEFGNAIHHALNLFFRKKFKDKITPLKEDLIGFFKRYMEKHQSDFPASSFSSFEFHGEEVLGNYFNENIGKWSFESEDSYSEYHVGQVVLEGVPCKGLIDRIEISNMNAEVTDYKTGKLNKLDIMEPNDKYVYGGKYWRQLAFYKLLLERDTRLNIVIKKSTISYVEPQNNKMVEFSFNNLDTEPIKGLIKNTWNGIRSHIFMACGKEDCKYCSQNIV
jgi:DNA helicase-2/ATP-dependent DNA helicase PcrA